MNIDDIRTVLVVGAGTMGQMIGLQCAWHGYDVNLYDISTEILDHSMQQIRTYTERLVKQGRMSQTEASEAIERIRPGTDMQRLGSNADLVSEAVPEDPELKKKVYKQLNQACPPRTIFATNTSTLLPSMFAEASGRSEKLAALHFHTPPWSSPVVDIMPHPGTSQETLQILEAFARRIDQIPIVMQKESSGYVFNAMLVAFLSAAMQLVANHVASVEDVDRAWMGILHTQVGPFGILDVVGLETAYDISKYWGEVRGDEKEKQNAQFLKQYVDTGKLGVKTGEGFYHYPNPTYQQPGFLQGTTE